MAAHSLSLLSALLVSLMLGVQPGTPANPPDEEEIYTEIDLEMLTRIEYEEGQELPEDVTAYDGQKVTIQGYMGPYTQEGSTTFRLITDACGCDGPPKIQHFVQVNMGDTVIGYKPELITVKGTLAVSEKKEDDFVINIYRLKAVSWE